MTVDLRFDLRYIVVFAKSVFAEGESFQMEEILMDEIAVGREIATARAVEVQADKDLNMHTLVYSLALVAVYVAARVSEVIDLYKLVLVLGVTLVGGAGFHYFLHRAASYIRYAERSIRLIMELGQPEARVLTWEDWLGARHAKVWMVPATALLRIAAPLYVTVKSAAELYQLHEYLFLEGVGVAAVIGAVLFWPLSIKFAGK
jgi:hypothetical protein